METKQNKKTNMPVLQSENTLEKQIKIKHLLIAGFVVVCIAILLYSGTTILQKHDQKVSEEVLIKVALAARDKHVYVDMDANNNVILKDKNTLCNGVLTNTTP